MKSPAVFVFCESEWNTERTYNNNFKTIPNTCGVYLLVNRTYNNTKTNYEILYVGSSKNLKQRYNKHEVLRLLKEFYNDVVFYFVETNNYITTERNLIQQTKARFNKQWL